MKSVRNLVGGGGGGRWLEREGSMACTIVTSCHHTHISVPDCTCLNITSCHQDNRLYVPMMACVTVFPYSVGNSQHNVPMMAYV